MLDFSLLTNCLCLNIKYYFVLLNTSALLVVDLSTSQSFLAVSIFLALCCLTPRVTVLFISTCLRPSVSIFLALFCSTPWLALLIVQLSLLSGSFVNNLTFVGPVLVSFSLGRPNLLLPIFHSPKLFSISTFFSSLSIRLSVLLLLFSSVFTRTQPSHAVAKIACIYINK